MLKILRGKIRLGEHLRRWRRQSVRWLRLWGTELLADDCPDLAAQMSFYFVMSLFPFLMLIAAIIGWLPATNFWQSFAEWIVDYLPPASQRALFATILDLTRGYSGAFSFGLIGTLWSASSGFVSLMESLSLAHGVRETRSFWRKHAIAAGATFAAAAFLLGSFGLLALGHRAAAVASHPLQHALPFRMHWELLRWFGTLLLMCLYVDLVDYLLPDLRRPWRWLPPSTVFVALMFVAATAGFNSYVRYVSNFAKLYGALAGFIIFMLWIYLANLILLAGAEAEKVSRKMRDEQGARAVSGAPA